MVKMHDVGAPAESQDRVRLRRTLKLRDLIFCGIVIIS